MNKNRTYQIMMIYTETLKKFYEGMRDINILEDEEIFNYLRLEFDKVIDLIRQFKEGLIDFQAIKILYDISFKDLVKDKYILEAVSCNKTILSSDLFISTVDRELNDHDSLFRIKNENNQSKIVRYCEGKVTERDLKISDLKYFVSLERALDKSDYIGYRANGFYNALILYSGKIDNSKYITLFKSRDEFKVYVSEKSYLNNGLFYKIHSDEKVQPYIKLREREEYLDTGIPSLDKLFILMTIQEQIEKQYADVYKKVR